MAEMVRMPFENSERPIHLLEQHHASEFMRKSHSSERQLKVALLAGFVAETVGGSDRKYQRQRIALTMVTDELSKFFGRELFSACIQEHKPAARAVAISPAKFQERSFIFEGNSINFGVLG